MNPIVLVVLSILSGICGLGLFFVLIVIVGKLTGSLRVIPANEDVVSPEEIDREWEKMRLSWWAIKNRRP